MTLVKMKNRMVKQFNMRGAAAGDLAYTGCLYLEFAVVSGHHGKNPVCFTEIAAFDDNSFGSITPHRQLSSYSLISVVLSVESLNASTVLLFIIMLY